MLRGEEHQIIKLNLILDKEYKLIGYEILEYKHSSNKWKNNIIAYLDELVTAKADIVKIEDHLHDVTGSTNSGNLVNSMFRDLSEFINRELDLYYQLFGAGYEKEAFVADEFKSLLGKQNVKANEKGKTDGYVYTLELEGLYKGTDSGIIKINFILDVNHVLIGYEFVEYTHSGKKFQARIVTYLDSLVLEKADIVLIENYISDVTGSTNSGKLINEMLRFNEYVINELDVYYQLFGY